MSKKLQGLYYDLLHWEDEAREKAILKKRLEEHTRAVMENLELVRRAIQAEMGSVNEYQIEVGDELVSFKYTTPRASVKVLDIDAVPGEFIRVEKSPKKREIAEYLQNHSVNWASLEMGEPQLTYKIEERKHD